MHKIRPHFCGIFHNLCGSSGEKRIKKAPSDEGAVERSETEGEMRHDYPSTASGPPPLTRGGSPAALPLKMGIKKAPVGVVSKGGRLIVIQLHICSSQGAGRNGRSKTESRVQGRRGSGGRGNIRFCRRVRNAGSPFR